MKSPFSTSDQFNLTFSPYLTSFVVSPSLARGQTEHGLPPISVLSKLLLIGGAKMFDSGSRYQLNIGRAKYLTFVTIDRFYSILPPAPNAFLTPEITRTPELYNVALNETCMIDQISALPFKTDFLGINEC